MTELQWEPAQLGRLTIPQLICLGQDKAPGESGKSLNDWHTFYERKAREDAEWVAS